MKNIYYLFHFIKRVIDRVYMCICKYAFNSVGKNVIFHPTSSSFSYNSIIIGNDVYIGPGANFSSITYIKIGNKVLFGPNVTIMAGDHNTNCIGKYMFDVEDKLPENDLPVTIEDDVWVGTDSIILKGVTIGTGSVIAAGSVVTKNVDPYSVVAGVPATKIKMRFTEEEIKKHKKILEIY